MTPAKELRSLRAKLKRRDKRVWVLSREVIWQKSYIAYMTGLWARAKDENYALQCDLDEEMSQVGRLQGEIAAIHTINALRAAQAKILVEKDSPSC